jgi:hypothetical protein
MSAAFSRAQSLLTFPVQQSVKVELILNLIVAKALRSRASR